MDNYLKWFGMEYKFLTIIFLRATHKAQEKAREWRPKTKQKKHINLS